MLETEIYVVLSTSHLKPETCAALEQTGLIYDEGEARIRIRLPQEFDPIDTLCLTADLQDCTTYVRREAPEAYGIMFDRDGPEEPGLASYEWT